MSRHVRILLITDVRDAAEEVGRLAEEVVGQTRPPDRWFAVDHGSRDGTLNRLRRLQTEIAFLDVLCPPPPCRALGEPECFEWSLRQTFLGRYTHVARAGIGARLAQHDLERLLAPFTADTGVGVVAGARASLYSVECLAALRAARLRSGSDPDEAPVEQLGFRAVTDAALGRMAA